MPILNYIIKIFNKIQEVFIKIFNKIQAVFIGNQEIIISILAKIIFVFVIYLLITKIFENIFYQIAKRKSITEENIKQFLERIETIIMITNSMLRIILILIICLIILNEFKIKITTILASLGAFLGLLIFVLQSFIQNFIRGIILILQDQIRKNEWVQINDNLIGKVLEINLTSIVLRDQKRNLIFIPNSSINTVRNLSRYEQKFFIHIKIKRANFVEDYKEKLNKFIEELRQKFTKIKEFKLENDFDIYNDFYVFNISFKSNYLIGEKTVNELKLELLKKFGDEIIEITDS